MILDNTEVRMSKRKCTDMKNNRKVMLPPPRSAKGESVLEVRKDAWLDVFK